MHLGKVEHCRVWHFSSMSRQKFMHLIFLHKVMALININASFVEVNQANFSLVILTHPDFESNHGPLKIWRFSKNGETVILILVLIYWNTFPFSCLYIDLAMWCTEQQFEQFMWAIYELCHFSEPWIWILFFWSSIHLFSEINEFTAIYLINCCVWIWILILISSS